MFYSITLTFEKKVLYLRRVFFGMLIFSKKKKIFYFILNIFAFVKQ